MGIIKRVQILCAEERIPGAIRIDSSWAIPADAEKPVDERIKSGKYIKQKNKNGDNGNGKKPYSAGAVKLITKSKLFTRD